MRTERVRDALDPRLRDFTDLRDVQLRSAREPAEGLFVAEGDVTIRRALAAGYEPRAVLCTERWLGQLGDVPDDVRAMVVDDDVLTATVGFHVHRGALASFHRRPLPGVGEIIGNARRIVVLEDVSDHTNVGAIFRSVAGLGADGVMLTPRCADPLYRRAVRTSMGAVFAVPWTRIDWMLGPRLIRDAGFALLALTPAADAATIHDLDQVELPRVALAVGSEGSGLSDHWLAAADIRMRIPMHSGVDSLNVAAATAVVLYAVGDRAACEPLPRST